MFATFECMGVMTNIVYRSKRVEPIQSIIEDAEMYNRQNKFIDHYEKYNTSILP